MQASTTSGGGLPEHHMTMTAAAAAAITRMERLDVFERPEGVRLTAATVLASAPRPTRMAMPSISSSMTPLPPAVFRFRARAGRVGAGSAGAVNTAGTNSGSGADDAANG